MKHHLHQKLHVPRGGRHRGVDGRAGRAVREGEGGGGVAEGHRGVEERAAQAAQPGRHQEEGEGRKER